MWSTHSWNIGPVHIISFSTEVYFFIKSGLDLLFKQYEWLQKDLEVLHFALNGLTLSALLNRKTVLNMRLHSRCKQIYNQSNALFF